MLSCAQTLTIIEMPNKLIQSVLKFKAFNILATPPFKILTALLMDS